MNFYENRPQKDALYYFGLICSIPHPSGHEKQLAETLKNLAEQQGLSTVMDSAGTLRIDRPASAGMEHAPHIILQGHLDMVPKAAPDKAFDFAEQPLELLEEEGYLHADRTTLGADNGAGVASALAILLDPELKTGAVSGLFTISEETGLIGANALDPEMLKGDWLFNLDAGNYHNFCIGCAGGARLSFRFPVSRIPAPEETAYAVQLTGLAGGHSGSKIHEKRGNALILLCQFLKRAGITALCSLNGGSADNAIPAEAEALILTAQSRETLEALAEQFRRESSGTFQAPGSYQIAIAPAEPETAILEPGFTETFLTLSAAVPNEVFDFDPQLKIVKTSSNFASVHTKDDFVEVHTSQRSLDDDSRKELTGKIAQHFAPLGGTAEVSGEYPGWPAKADSAPIRFVGKIHQEVFGEPHGVYAVHAGLETGAFAKKNPALEIISFGPMEEDIHTERERLHLEKYEEFNRLLRYIIEQAGKL